MPLLSEISFDCSIQIVNRAAVYTMSEKDSQNAEKITFSPAHPRRVETRLSPGEAADEKNTRDVSSEDFFKARTQLEAFFSILSHKCRQGCIHNRVSDQSF